MAYEGPQIKIPGLTASADNTASQYMFVKMSGEKTVTICSAATDLPIGVLQNAPDSGEDAEVVAIGVTKIIGNADIDYSDRIGVAAQGFAGIKTAGTDDYIVGAVLQGNGGSAGYITAFVNCIGAAKLGT